MHLPISVQKAKRGPHWLRLLFVFIGVIAILMSGVQTDLSRAQKRFLELGLAALLMGAFVLHPVVSQSCRTVGKLKASLLLMWPLLILIVDTANPRHSSLYPFVSWKMFTGAIGSSPPPVQYRYEGTFTTGASQRLIPGGTVSDVVSSALDGELRIMIERLPSGGEHARRQLTSALRGVARLAEAATPNHSLRTVTIERCSMPVVPPYRVSCAPIFATDVTP